MSRKYVSALRPMTIKTFGTYEVKCKLGYEVSGTVYVTVCEQK